MSSQNVPSVMYIPLCVITVFGMRGNREKVIPSTTVDNLLQISTQHNEHSDAFRPIRDGKALCWWP